jgi:hypothetical protein
LNARIALWPVFRRLVLSRRPEAAGQEGGVKKEVYQTRRQGIRWRNASLLRHGGRRLQRVIRIAREGNTELALIPHGALARPIGVGGIGGIGVRAVS